MRGIEYSVSLATGAAITLLRFTGIRINEIISLKQYLQLLEKKEIQIYQIYINKDRIFLLSNGARKPLNKLKMEGMNVFYKRKTLAGGRAKQHRLPGLHL